MTIEECLVAIDDVIEDRGLMVRERLSDKTIADYAVAIRDGAEFPPVDCMRIDGEIFVYDGFHRLTANRHNKATEIRIRVRNGTHSDALRAAIKAGAHSSLRFSNADKRRCVRLMLADPKWRERSARWIAAEVGVDHKTVAAAAKQGSTGEIPQLNAAKQPKRLGRDGRERQATRARKTAARPTIKPTAPVTPPPAAKLPTFTREELGMPPPELAQQPDPDYPNRTRADVFNERWGNVYVQLPQERVLRSKQTNVQSFITALKEFSTAAAKFLKAKGIKIAGTLPGEHGFDPQDLATLFTAEEFLGIIATMPEATQRLRLGQIELHMDALMTALRLLEPYAAALKARPVPQENGAESGASHDVA